LFLILHPSSFILHSFRPTELIGLSSTNPLHCAVGNNKPEAFPETAALTPSPKHPSDLAAISLHQVLDESPADTLPAHVLAYRDH
jgi:hypothetical protein